MMSIANNCVQYHVALTEDERAEIERVKRIEDAHKRLVEIAKRPELWFRV